MNVNRGTLYGITCRMYNSQPSRLTPKTHDVVYVSLDAFNMKRQGLVKTLVPAVSGILASVPSRPLDSSHLQFRPHCLQALKIRVFNMSPFVINSIPVQDRKPLDLRLTQEDIYSSSLLFHQYVMSKECSENTSERHFI